MPQSVLAALKSVAEELDEAQQFYESATAARPGFRRNPAKWGAMGLLDRLVDESQRPKPGLSK